MSGRTTTNGEMKGSKQYIPYSPLSPSSSAINDDELLKKLKEMGVDQKQLHRLLNDQVSDANGDRREEEEKEQKYEDELNRRITQEEEIYNAKLRPPHLNSAPSIYSGSEMFYYSDSEENEPLTHNASKWSKDQVQLWLDTQLWLDVDNLKKIQNAFKRLEIDGKQLLNISQQKEEEIKQLFPFSLYIYHNCDWK